MADQTVMPVAAKAMDCLRQQVLLLTNPPANFQMRPGTTFSPMADATRDECCEGVAWVRPGFVWETDEFPVQRSTAERIGPAYLAVQIELGVVRCLPTQGLDGDGTVVDATQWLTALQASEDDRWALRKAVCCLVAEYGQDAVVVGQYAPLENEANCSGVSVIVTIRRPFCDC